MFDEVTNWLERVPFLQAKLNRTFNSSRNATLYKIIHGHNPRLKGELVTQVHVPAASQAQTKRIASLRSSIRKWLQQAKIKQSIQSNKLRRPALEFKVSDQVMLSTTNLPLATAYRKTAPEFIGPLPISKAFYGTDNHQQKVTFGFTRIICILIQIIRKMHEIQTEGLQSRVCIARIQIHPAGCIIPHRGLRSHTVDHYPLAGSVCTHKSSCQLNLHSQIRVWAQKSVYGLRNPCVGSQIYENLAAF